MLAAASSRSDDLLSLRLEGGTDAAAVARRAIGRLSSGLDPGTLDTVRLLVTELVTNSVRHADAPAVDLRVRVSERRVRLDVRDDGPGFLAEQRSPHPGPEGGWGLFLVDHLADRWGVDERGRGSHVWVELARPTG
jgi:signal transduction histidine kinase